jgi:hypothetical protein
MLFFLKFDYSLKLVAGNSQEVSKNRGFLRWCHIFCTSALHSLSPKNLEGKIG